MRGKPLDANVKVEIPTGYERLSDDEVVTSECLRLNHDLTQWIPYWLNEKGWWVGEERPFTIRPIRKEGRK